MTQDAPKDRNYPNISNVNYSDISNINYSDISNINYSDISNMKYPDISNANYSNISNINSKKNISPACTFLQEVAREGFYLLDSASRKYLGGLNIVDVLNKNGIKCRAYYINNRIMLVGKYEDINFIIHYVKRDRNPIGKNEIICLISDFENQQSKFINQNDVIIKGVKIDKEKNISIDEILMKNSDFKPF
ncbi:19225_t:CDS:2 [Racocetra persica]|uniref:19225_t:CDS:1 n=1 Tax=Racocetra persica TaxID=160502 RepID=A0ACA9KE89_9GLOM|nr:19225_t:CDS:2 [Racocetra persica]